MSGDESPAMSVKGKGRARASLESKAGSSLSKDAEDVLGLDEIGLAVFAAQAMKRDLQRKLEGVEREIHVHVPVSLSSRPPGSATEHCHSVSCARIMAFCARFSPPPRSRSV
jgi:hypothetical protein